ncbi:MAG: hypothetical protein ACXWQR_04575 [Ktedonobacterales bacterium]
MGQLDVQDVAGLWWVVLPMMLPDFLPFLPGFSFCVGERCGEGGNIGALWVPCAGDGFAIFAGDIAGDIAGDVAGDVAGDCRG